MGRADPLVTAVLADLARGLGALQVGFCVIGALVPELLLDEAPPQMTKDADVSVLIDTLADFERLKKELERKTVDTRSRRRKQVSVLGPPRPRRTCP